MPGADVSEYPLRPCNHAELDTRVMLHESTESTGASIERTKMPNLRNGSKWGFEPGLT